MEFTTPEYLKYMRKEETLRMFKIMELENSENCSEILKILEKFYDVAYDDAYEFGYNRGFDDGSIEGHIEAEEEFEDTGEVSSWR